MKKYKPTGVKKYTPIGERHPEELAEDYADLIQNPTQPVLENPEPILKQAAAEASELPAEQVEPVLVQDHQEKTKKRLWSSLSHKEPATKTLPQPISSTDASEEEREPMQNTYSGSNTASVNEPSAVISKMMVINGDVKLDTSLLLAGKVTGNIQCDDHIEVQSNGAVEGNITANSIKLSGGTIKGNITCEGSLETDKDTVITGDISASVIIISGKVNGEIRAKESVTLSSSAVVKGDLFSAAISVEKGALLEGKYSVSASLE